MPNPTRKRHPKWKYTDSGPGKNSDLVPPGGRLYPIEEMTFLAFSPDTEPGRTPPTQVHMIMSVQGFPLERFHFCIKTPEAATALIGILEEYRDIVWPDAKSKDLTT